MDTIKTVLIVLGVIFAVIIAYYALSFVFGMFTTLLWLALLLGILYVAGRVVFRTMRNKRKIIDKRRAESGEPKQLEQTRAERQLENTANLLEEYKQRAVVETKPRQTQKQ